MLVFSSGLMTFNSRSNWASAALERSILALSSSSWRFHERGEAGGGAEADIVRVLQVGLGDGIGDVGGERPVGGAIADLSK